MDRLVNNKLYNWSNNENRLPLFIVGARQIGKTYSVLEFASKNFENKYIYINFMNKDEYYKQLFNLTNPKDIINVIKMISNKDITEDWLIIFDEIQEVSSIKTSLKLFVEQNLKYRIISLVSYLGNILNDSNSFPVGKVQYIEMFPMNFEEFLMALNKYELIKKIKESIKNNVKLSEVDHNILIDLLHTFMIVGGMPKVLQTYLDNKNDLLLIDNLKQEILSSYLKDIVKYIESNQNKLKAQNIFNNIPNFLAKENKKFMLSTIDKNARYRDYDLAIYSLLQTKMIYQINNLNSFKSPIISNRKESEFKIYYNDCGFLSSVFKLTKQGLVNIESNNKIRGAIAENFIVSELMQIIDNRFISYYTFRDKNNNQFEIDLCIENNELNLVPIEIKFGLNKSGSLNKLINENNIDFSIVFSSSNFSYDKEKKIKKIPLYAVGFLEYEFSRIKK